MNSFSDLSGKRVVVTGACGIIGRWIADAFRASGADLCLTDVDKSSLESVGSELELSEASFTKVADLTDEASIDAWSTRSDGAGGAPMFW